MLGRLPASTPNIGRSDGDFHGVPSILSVSVTTFLQENFSVSIGLSCIADDDLLALALTSGARLNHDFFTSKLIIFIGKGSVSTCIS
jgi:hypothetical protein